MYFIQQQKNIASRDHCTLFNQKNIVIKSAIFKTLPFPCLAMLKPACNSFQTSELRRSNYDRRQLTSLSTLTGLKKRTKTPTTGSQGIKVCVCQMAQAAVFVRKL